MQVRSRIPRTPKEQPSQLKVQDQGMRSVCDWGKLHVRGQMQLHSQEKVRVRGGGLVAEDRFGIFGGQGRSKIWVSTSFPFTMNTFWYQYFLFIVHLWRIKIWNIIFSPSLTQTPKSKNLHNHKKILCPGPWSLAAFVNWRAVYSLETWNQVRFYPWVVVTSWTVYWKSVRVSARTRNGSTVISKSFLSANFSAPWVFKPWIKIHSCSIQVLCHFVLAWTQWLKSIKYYIFIFLKRILVLVSDGVTFSGPEKLIILSWAWIVDVWIFIGKFCFGRSAKTVPSPLDFIVMERTQIRIVIPRFWDGFVVDEISSVAKPKAGGPSFINWWFNFIKWPGASCQ